MDLPRITFHRTIIPQSCDSEFSGHACGATVCQLWQCVLEVRLIVHVLSFFGPCVAPPAAHSRTLQWDTDPSVLQLQADSELGYFLPPLSFCCSFPLIIFPLAILSLCLSFNAQYSIFQSFPVCPVIYLPLSVLYLALPLSFSFFLSLSDLNAFSWLLSSCLPGAEYDIDWFTLTSTGAESFFIFILKPMVEIFCHICINTIYLQIPQAKSQS